MNKKTFRRVKQEGLSRCPRYGFVAGLTHAVGGLALAEFRPFSVPGRRTTRRKPTSFQWNLGQRDKPSKGDIGLMHSPSWVPQMGV